MFDIGGWEFLVIVVVAIVVIGPKDLPHVIKGVSQWMAKARELAREFRAGLDELSREVELDKLEREVRSSVGVDELDKTVHSIRNDVENAGREIERSAEPARIGRDEYEEAHSFFEERPDASPDDLEEARRRKAQHEALHGAHDAASEVGPPAPPAAGAKPGG
jgi:sec-independent protein translocase protein TatB